MSLFTLDNDDLEKYAEYMGITGEDYDLFYEVYYSLDNEQYEMELTIDTGCSTC